MKIYNNIYNRAETVPSRLIFFVTDKAAEINDELRCKYRIKSAAFATNFNNNWEKKHFCSWGIESFLGMHV